ncbi:MAG: hypothetical protein H7067_02475 [Burkholderiales bacterium]|nr:hypothetical protein [Opitutaceae bacterium]
MKLLRACLQAIPVWFLAASMPAAQLTFADKTLRPLPAAVFGQFLERPSWGGEYGPEAVCDAAGRLPPPVEAALAGLRAPLVRFPFGTDGDYTDWQDLADLTGRAARPVTVGHKGDPVTNRFGFPEYFELAGRQGWRTILVVNLRDALHRKKPLPEAAAHAAGLLRYALTLAPADRIAAVQVGNEGWFFWPPKPEEREPLGLPPAPDLAADASWLRACLVAYADALLAVLPDLPLICDAPRPLDGGGLENNAATVWRAAVDHPDVRARYRMLAAHAYAPMGLWTTQRAGETVRAADLTPDEIWLAALACLGRFDAQGQAVADLAAYDGIQSLGYQTAVTEWNWNGWDWKKRFPHAGFDDGVPAALGTAGFLHGLMRHPSVALATQSMMLGTSWGITSVRARPDGTVGYLPQGEAMRILAEHHGTRVVSSMLSGVPDLGAPVRLTTWWPATENVAQLDALVTADASAWYVHLVHRHRTEPLHLRIHPPAASPSASSATLHLLIGSPETTTSSPGRMLRSQTTITSADEGFSLALPPASVSVLVIPTP